MSSVARPVCLVLHSPSLFSTPPDKLLLIIEEIYYPKNKTDVIRFNSFINNNFVTLLEITEGVRRIEFLKLILNLQI